MHLKFKHLLEISAKLRGEGGCPWDKKQTLATMRDCLVEEAEELSQAILAEDIDNIEEEMGDLMFTLILMAQIAKEDGHFNMGDVLERNAEKIISRHTWVFGTDTAETPEEALALWMKNKEKERKKKSYLPETS